MRAPADVDRYEQRSRETKVLPAPTLQRAEVVRVPESPAGVSRPVPRPVFQGRPAHLDFNWNTSTKSAGLVRTARWLQVL